MPQRILTYWNLHRIPILLAFLSAVLYYVFAYHLVREDFVRLLALYAALFFLCYKLIQFEKWNFTFLLIVGILFRLVFLVALPNLSQDFFRFIWDGELVRHFVNPYLFVPNTLIEQPDLVIANAQELYSGMGGLSARHFSNYPPLNQLFFALAAFFGGKSVLGTVVGMRTIIVFADIGLFYFGRKLLRNLNLSPHLIFWYFLNPLLIVEGTGNLHFEGVMLFFFIWALYLLSVKKWAWAAVPYAMAIMVKLVPLMFLPLFLKYLGLRKSSIFYALIGLISLVFLLPFYAPEFADNYTKTVGLWFSNFEFNAGPYNLIKKIALIYEYKPWELVKDYGKITPYITILLVLLLSAFKVNKSLDSVIRAMLWILTAYYFMSTTVHPWYIIFLLPLGLFSQMRFPVVWSATVVLSYYAYSLADYTENMWLIAIEYLTVVSFFCYEFIKRRKQKPLFRKN